MEGTGSPVLWVPEGGRRQADVRAETGCSFTFQMAAASLMHRERGRRRTGGNLRQDAVIEK